MKIIILAGGDGTRLWPLSRKKHPKQVLPVTGKDTLLKQTYFRIRKAFRPKDIFVVAGKSCQSNILKQLPRLPRENIFFEPVRRDSASAIGLAACRVCRDNPKEIIVSAHSDAWIDDNEKFARALARAVGAVERRPNYTFLYGVRPTYPEPGYGYIQVSTKRVHCSGVPMYYVKRFIEKPNISLARRLVKRDDVYWNIGLFAWRADHLMSLFRSHLPSHFKIFNKISQAPEGRGLREIINREFPKLKSAAIDYAILEKTKNILFHRLPVRWSDIGHWRSVREVSNKDSGGNVVSGDSVLLNSKNNLFLSSSGKLISAVDVNDLIVVETEDAILVANADSAQEVKKMTKNFKKNKFKKYL